MALKKYRQEQILKEKANQNDYQRALAAAEELREKQGNSHGKNSAQYQERDDILEARAKLEQAKAAENKNKPEFKVNAYGIKKLVDPLQNEKQQTKKKKGGKQQAAEVEEEIKVNIV